MLVLVCAAPGAVLSSPLRAPQVREVEARLPELQWQLDNYRAVLKDHFTGVASGCVC